MFLGFLAGAGDGGAVSPGDGLGRGATIATAVVAVARGGDVGVTASPVAMHCNVPDRNTPHAQQASQHDTTSNTGWEGSELKNNLRKH